MAVTRERFEQGMTYDEYKSQMTRNRERLDANESKVELDPADVAALKRLPKTLNVLVLAEDWCGDVIDNLPVLGRLAQESGKLNVRVFLRDQNLDIMDQYLNQGQFRSIPVFVVFDDGFNELGHFIERPASVTARRAEQRSQVFAKHPEFGSPDTPITQMAEDVRTKLMEELLPLREQSRAEDNREVVATIREIIERVPA